MKVAQVMPRFGPGGGIVTIVRETTRRLQPRGFDFGIFTRLDDGPILSKDPDATERFPVRRFAPGSSAKLRFPLLTGLSDALAKSGSDLIHAHNHRAGHVLQAAHVARRLRVPLVVSTYYHPAHREDPRLKRAAVRILDFGFGLSAYGGAGALVTLSRAEVEHVRPFSFSAPIYAVPPGIDLESWNDISSDRRDPRLPSEYILYSGRIAPHKGLGTLLRAQSLVPSAERLPLVLVGPETTPGFQQTLVEQAASLGIRPSVVFLGHVGTPALYRGTVRGARALVLASEWESFGLVLIEAMAAGTPVIAAGGGAVPHVLAEGRAGLLVPYGDGNALAEAIRAILRDSGAARARAEFARSHVRVFKWELTTDSLRSIYEGLSRH